MGMFGFDRVRSQKAACRGAHGLVKMGKNVSGNSQLAMAA